MLRGRVGSVRFKVVGHEFGRSDMRAKWINLMCSFNDKISPSLEFWPFGSNNVRSFIVFFFAVINEKSSCNKCKNEYFLYPWQLFKEFNFWSNVKALEHNKLPK